MGEFSQYLKEKSDKSVSLTRDNRQPTPISIRSKSNLVRKKSKESFISSVEDKKSENKPQAQHLPNNTTQLHKQRVTSTINMAKQRIMSRLS